MKKQILILILLLFNIQAISQINPCTLTGGNVYIDHNNAPWMMNATVNGMSTYSYAWTDTNGVIVSTGNQTPFYTQWCVKITDNVTACDTTICQDCIADTNAMCPCIMIYMPVCGCDGVMYANSCLADCADVPWTPAISNGMPGGFLPCNQPNTCEVEISGDSILCNLGNPIILQASPSATSNNFVSYYWTNGQSNNNILTVTTPGKYCVVATDSSGCVDSACFTVAMNEIDIYSVPNPAVICKGDSIVLEIDPAYSNIIWATGDTSDRIVVYPLTQTTYVVEAIDNNGCDARGELTVDVLYSPFLFINSVPNPPNICLGDSILLEASAGFVNYYWFNGMTGDRIVDFPTQDSWYMVEAVDSNGCVVKEDIWAYVDSCNTSVNELFDNQLKIYPNPTYSKVNIELPKGIVANISLRDFQGRILHQRKNVFEYYIFNTKDFAKGTYLIKIESTEGEYSTKLLIE